MTPQDFCYWLQGFFEVSDTDKLNAHQTTIVKNHLSLVFEHIDLGTYKDKETEQKLNNVHSPGGGFPTLIRC